MDFKKNYFNLWSEAWQFHKKFAGMAGTDAEWQRAVDTAGAIAEKYRDKPEYEFMKLLILAVMVELENQDKRKRQQEDKENER